MGQTETLQPSIQTVLASDEFDQTTNIGFVYQDQTGAILDANTAAATLLGMTHDQLLGRKSVDPRWRAIHEDGSNFPGETHPAMATLATGEPAVDVIMGVETPDAARRWISINTYPLLVEGRVEGVLCSFFEVTARIQRDHLLALLSDVTQYVTAASSVDDLLRHVCDTLVTLGGHALAWIGVESETEPFGIDIPYAAGITDYVYPGIVSADPDAALGQGPAGLVMRDRQVRSLNDISTQPLSQPWARRLQAFGLASAACLPLDVGRPAILTVYDRHTVAFDDDVVAGLGELIREVELGVTHLRALEQRARAFAGTLGVIAGVTERRDPYTEGHQVRVGDLAGAIARRLGLGEERVTLIIQGGEVHDVGKIVVPSEILARPGRLSSVEFQLIKRHAEVGADLLARAELPAPIPEIARQHHERLDGSGYPQGLRGDDIILEARIVAVADVVEAMAHDRPYRPALGTDVALAEVRSGAGTLYDAAAAAACLALFAEGYAFPEFAPFDTGS